MTEHVTKAALCRGTTLAATGLAASVLSMAALEGVLASRACPRFLPMNDGDQPTKIDELRDELVELTDQANNLQSRADAEKRSLTEDEDGQIAAIFNRFEQVEAEIERRETIAAQRARAAEPQGRRTDPNDVAAAARDAGGEDQTTQQPRRRRAVAAQAVDPELRGRGGFRSFGEFAQCVKAAVRSGPGQIDPRLIQNAPTTTSTEGTGSDGGFAVPPDFRQNIMVKVTGEDSLLPRTDQLTSSSNSITLPKDETTPWQGSGGIQAYWEGEGNQMSQSKVALEQSTIRLNKITALVPVTEELLEDASALSTYINRKAPEKIAFKVDDAIINGTGAGQPKGILAADALVTVSKESGQAADTIEFANIVNMFSRLYAGCRQDAVWLINQDIEPQLLSLQFPGSGTAVPVYLPPGGLADSPYGRLMGKPVLPRESCQTLGDKGDIILGDLSTYMTAMKTGGIRQDVSIHLWFDYDTTAFRFIMRVAGQPWWNAAITPKHGANTRSCFVTLEARG